MRVLVTNGYWLSLDPKQERQSKPYPPLATLIACAILMEQGHEVEFFDSTFECNEKSLIARFQHKPDVVLIYDDGFNYLTKMCLTNMRHRVFSLLAASHEKGVATLVASSDASDHTEAYLQAGATAVFFGEADDTLREWASLEEQSRFSGALPGMAMLIRGSVVRGTPRAVMTNLDALPDAAWKLLDVGPYKQAWSHHGGLSLNMATTRGCPFKCNWCAKPLYGNRYQVRSAARVAAELELMHSLFDMRHIWFCDDIFGLKPGWVESFRTEMALRKLFIPYKIQSRADLILRDTTCEDLAKSGCEEVWMGAESGSDAILMAMDKGITVAQIHRAVKLLYDMGIKPCLFLQFGYPGEGLPQIRETLSMVRELMPHDIGVSVSYPLPGTLFFERVKDQLKSKRNWENSDDLAMMYEGSYPASFYRQLHRYVHRDFRSRQQRKAVKEGNGIFKNASHALRSAAYRMLARVNYVFLSTTDGRL
jgi:radical SAM superfamily enzyme YgiQ (UPF0313 family)